LAVVKFTLPPLKDRSEDIPYLVDHFIKTLNARKGKKIISVSPDVMNILLKHDYPGNIRELENIIEYGFVVCHGSIIQIEHLPVEMYENDSVNNSEFNDAAIEAISEKNQLISVLKKNAGNINRTSDELGIHRTTLWRKLKRFNIDPKSL